MEQEVLATLYKFFDNKDPEGFKPILLNFLKEHNLKGTMILAHEGINGSVAGKKEDIDKYYNFLQNSIVGSGFMWKEYKVNTIEPFKKTKVKIKPEIVTFKIPVKAEPGIMLEPKEWDELILDKKTIVIDTRNVYEYMMGTFTNAIDPQTVTFKETPDWVEKHLSNTDKETPIAMFCTSGVRCEKSTSYMKDLGFKNVYHLKNGILAYLEKTKGHKNEWKGSCFVFDDRVSVNSDLIEEGNVHGITKYQFFNKNKQDATQEG